MSSEIFTKTDSENQTEYTDDSDSQILDSLYSDSSEELSDILNEKPKNYKSNNVSNINQEEEFIKLLEDTSNQLISENLSEKNKNNLDTNSTDTEQQHESQINEELLRIKMDISKILKYLTNLEENISNIDTKLSKKINKIDKVSDKNEINKMSIKINNKVSKKELSVLDKSLKDELKSIKKNLKNLSTSKSLTSLSLSSDNSNYLTKSDLDNYIKNNKILSNDNNIIDDEKMNIILDFVNKELTDRFTNHTMLIDEYIVKINNIDKKVNSLQNVICKSKFF